MKVAMRRRLDCYEEGSALDHSVTVSSLVVSRSGRRACPRFWFITNQRTELSKKKTIKSGGKPAFPTLSLMHLSNSNPTTWLPDLVYTNSRFASKLALVCDDTIAHLAGGDEVENAIRLKGRALLPGLINAHSHAFQRVIRGRTESHARRRLRRLAHGVFGNGAERNYCCRRVPLSSSRAGRKFLRRSESDRKGSCTRG